MEWTREDVVTHYEDETARTRSALYWRFGDEYFGYILTGGYTLQLKDAKDWDEDMGFSIKIIVSFGTLVASGRQYVSVQGDVRGRFPSFDPYDYYDDADLRSLRSLKGTLFLNPDNPAFLKPIDELSEHELENYIEGLKSETEKYWKAALVEYVDYLKAVQKDVCGILAKVEGELAHVADEHE